MAKRLIAFYQSKPDSDSTKAVNLRDAWASLAWNQIFARDFAGALASTDESRKLDPDNLVNESIRAYALMFLDRDAEAEAIYVGNIGRKMSATSDENRDTAITSDYDTIADEKLTSREIPRIRGLMRRAQYERLLGQYLQQLKTNPDDATALQYLPAVYFNMGRYREAADALKKRIAYLLRQNKHDADSTNTLVIAYGSLSWYQELSGDFAGALASTSEALKLDSSDLVAKMNHAHALLFLGRAKEAEPLYMADIGTKMKDGQYWDVVAASDLGTFEAQGFTSPDAVRIRERMRRAEYERLLAQYAQALKTNPNDPDAISGLPQVYFRLDRWKEAVDAQKIYIAALQRKPNHDSQWASTMSGADVAVAFYQLFTRDFAGSLASSDEAIKLDPKSLIAQTNRAHALLFLGRAKEAEAIYLGHRGENVFSNSDEKWETAILGDFDDLEKAGLTNPEIARIRALLKAPPK